MSLGALAIAAAMVVGRQPAELQAVIDLAYALGQSHALRLVCADARDQTWRTRMNRLLAVERPDDALRRRLVDSFNAGYTSARAEHPACDSGAAEAGQAAAEKGRALAERLAGDGP